jgi:N-methylhydantoinase A
MRYVGQSYTLDVEFPQVVDDAALEECSQRFHETHERVYGHARPSAPIEIVNVRVVHSWQLPGAELASPHVDKGEAAIGARAVYFEESGGYVETPIYRRSMLRGGLEIRGPAIVEQMDTTIVVYPGYTACLDKANNLVISAQDEERSLLHARSEEIRA